MKTMVVLMVGFQAFTIWVGFLIHPVAGFLALAYFGWKYFEVVFAFIGSIVLVSMEREDERKRRQSQEPYQFTKKEIEARQAEIDRF